MTDQIDPFAGQGDDDPFASTVTTDPAAEVEATDPAAEAPGGDIPVVDREGQPAEASALADQLDPPTPPTQQAPEEIETAYEAKDAEQPAPPVEEAQEAAQAAQEGDGAPEQPEEPQTPPVVAGEGQGSPADAQEASEGAQAPSETPETPKDPSAVPATGPRGGKGEMRRYKLLYQTAARQWTEYDLSTVDGPKLGVTIVTENGEPWMLARNNEHANRIAFAVLGRPKDGVFAFPVPRGAWKPKRIKPKPPEPARERLDIS